MDNLGNFLQCLPFKTFESVLQWTLKQSELSFTASTVPLNPHVKLADDRPRTLVCHDMRGGYLHDRFTQGVADDSAYRCFYWQHIDTFIYFSHHFVTVPPPAWTNTCHKHDVFCLGTVITEWDDGKERCVELLKSEQSYKTFADRLVLIAVSYGFDGWLINIENKIEETKIPNLVGFLSYLTARMHEALPRSQVLWYDSVIHTGELKWQDELNDNNELFFKCTDGIFLNYGWKDDTLNQSAVRARSRDRPWDVYVGVDVFGRGCFGGGGFDTDKAVEKIKQYNLSTALFATGWVFEKHEANFTQQEYKFWSLLVPHLHTKPIRSLPLCTSFCQGQGQQYFQQGKSISEKAWSNLSIQSLQPILPADPTLLGVDFTDAWQGANCLSLKAHFSSASCTLKYRLFHCNVELPGATVISYVYKQPSDVCFAIVLSVQNGDKKVGYVLGEKDAVKDIESSEMQLNDVPRSESSERLPAVCQHLQSNNGWSSRTFMIKDAEGLRLNEVAAYVSAVRKERPSQAIGSSTVKLGHLQISGTTIAQAPEPCELEVISYLLEQHEDCPNLVDISCELAWSFDKSHDKCQISYDESSREFVPTSQTFHVYYATIDRPASIKREHNISKPLGEHAVVDTQLSGEHKLVETSIEKTKVRSSGEDGLGGSTETFKSENQESQLLLATNGDNSASPIGNHVLIGSVMANSCDNSYNSVKKYRVCGLLVDMNVTHSLRFTIQPVDALGRSKDFSQCLYVDFPISRH